jgi:multidrug efflux pump subunit AcrA (membrane-fusion protein)
VQQNLARAQADQAQARIRAEQKVEGLQVDQRSRKLEAELAAIDIRKERAISQRQVALYRIAHRLAEFEEDAIAQRLSSAIRTRDAELEFHELTVKRRQQDLDRYAFYERRYKVIAPHAGVVRHAYNSRERRKFETGDSLRAGTKLLAIARDPALGVRFFVPEHRISELQLGAKVMVVSPSSGEELIAVVKRIDFFPQELGFLMELPNLPNAREKAFAVVAEFEQLPKGMTAGTELRVKGAAR